MSFTNSGGMRCLKQPAVGGASGAGGGAVAMDASVPGHLLQLDLSASAGGPSLYPWPKDASSSGPGIHLFYLKHGQGAHTTALPCCAVLCRRN